MYSTEHLTVSLNPLNRRSGERPGEAWNPVRAGGLCPHLT